MPHNAPVSVEITDIAFPNNYGVAKKEGRVIFVPGGIVGDTVRIRIMKEEKGYAYGMIEAIENPSRFRKNPVCPYSAACGGCTLQDLVYEKQLELKENYLRQTLRRIGAIDTDLVRISPITPSPDQYNYRSKLELAFGEKDGSVIVGMRERLSPFRPYEARVAPVEACPVFSVAVSRIVPIVCDFADHHGLSPYNPITGKGVLRHLIVRESKATGEIMVIIETAVDMGSRLKELPPMLAGEIPSVQSVYSAVNTKNGDYIDLGKPVLISGRPYIEERVGDLLFRIYPRSFFQPNPGAARVLYEKIAGTVKAGSAGSVLGLYCGSGSIELFLARYATKVVGVDSLPENISNAMENRRINNIVNCEFHTGRVEKLLAGTALQNPDIIVVDPPRSGISKEGMRNIMGMEPPIIAYVSCNPATLARDLRIILNHGFAIMSIMPFDFFPHTSHLETLVLLKR